MECDLGQIADEKSGKQDRKPQSIADNVVMLQVALKFGVERLGYAVNHSGKTD